MLQRPKQKSVLIDDVCCIMRDESSDLRKLKSFDVALVRKYVSAHVAGVRMT